MENVADVLPATPRQLDLLAAPGGEALAGQVAWTCDLADPARLEAAWEHVVACHPVLRTGVFTEGVAEPLQVVRARVAPAWEVHDASALAPRERGALAEAVAAGERARGFAPTAASPVRWARVALGGTEHRLVFTYHLLLLDEPSAALCLAQAAEAYAALGAGSPPPAARPAPRRAPAAEGDGAAFWRGALRGALLPAPGGQRGAAAFHAQELALGGGAAERLRALLRRSGAGWDALLAGAWALADAAETGEERAVVGVAVAGRAAGARDGAPGSFRHALPLAVSVPPEAELGGWLRGLQRAIDGWAPHSHHSLGQLRGWLGLAPGAPLFSAVVDAEPPPPEHPLHAPLRALGARGVVRVPPPGEHPLTLRLVPGEDAVLRMVHSAPQVDGGFAVERMGAVAALLARAAESPGASLRDLAPRRAARVAAGASWPGAGEVEAALAQHPDVAWTRVEEDGGALRAEVRLHPAAEARMEARRRLSFSLFYFADAGDGGGADKYRIYLEGGAFADRHGFEAVWAPERHFHENGGLYPNPSLLSAALAPLTRRVGLRAGSVALPLHHPLRVAEEWSVVDNLSGGRAGISVTSGWIPNDFALAPHNFAAKREVMWRALDEVRTLWRGGTLATVDGAGKPVDLRVFPRPLQPELPVWITCSGDPGMFDEAGARGFHCLTALLTHPLEEAAVKIARYRAARAEAGHDAGTGRVTLMLHTFVDDDLDEVLERVRAPLTAYLRSHIGLMETMVKSLEIPTGLDTPEWMDQLATFAFERYFRTAALMGTPESCLPMVDRVAAAGVDEVACLIDFGVDADAVLRGLERLDALRALCQAPAGGSDGVLGRYLRRRFAGTAVPVEIRVGREAPAVAT